MNKQKMLDKIAETFPSILANQDTILLLAYWFCVEKFGTEEEMLELSKEVIEGLALKK